MTVLPEQGVETLSGRVDIRSLHRVGEMPDVVELQRLIWGYGEDDTDPPYPARALFALVQSGGLLAGVFHQQALVGFGLAWIGLRDDSRTPYLHSQLAGLREDFRNLGLGFHLKCYQREFARKNGIALVRWTFDPSRPANANLNIRKLGAIVEQFLPDHYGEVRGRFGQGLPSHRVRADWYVDSARVRQRLSRPPVSPARLPPIPRVDLSSSPASGDRFEEALRERRFLIELPSQGGGGTAGSWQRGNGHLLERGLAEGYLVTDLLILDSPPRRSFYLLERAPLEALLEAGDVPAQGSEHPG